VACHACTGKLESVVGVPAQEEKGGGKGRGAKRARLAAGASGAGKPAGKAAKAAAGKGKAGAGKGKAAGGKGKAAAKGKGNGKGRAAAKGKGKARRACQGEVSGHHVGARKHSLQGPYESHCMCGVCSSPAYL